MWRVGLQLKHVNKIWDRGDHNAFTDLCWFQGNFYLVFRQASDHVSNDGQVVVLISSDGVSWNLSAEIYQAETDLRDPKIIVTPDQRLLLSCAGVKRDLAGTPLQSYIYFSTDGKIWSAPKAVGTLNHWLWRYRFVGDCAYAVAYFAPEEATYFYKLSLDGQALLYCDPLFSKQQNGLGYPNEHDLFTLDDGSLGCLLRRDADTGSAQLGLALPPYNVWQWRDLEVRIGGPVLLRLSTGSLLAAVRLYQPTRTSLCLLDVDKGRLEEQLVLPSGGDTSYAGLVEQQGTIWCSYYSSHEGKTAIYMAQISSD